MATIRKRGDGFQVGIVKAGYSRKSKTFKTKSAAKAWARKVEMQMDEGTFIDDKEIISHKLSDLIRNYIKELEDTDTPVLGSKLSSLLRMAREFGNDSLKDLTPQYLLAYSKRRRKTVTASTLQKDMSYLKQVIAYGIVFWKLPIAANPVEVTKPALGSLKMIAGSKRRTRRLREGEWETLMAGVGRQHNSETGNNWLSPMIEFAVESCMRMGEIHRLTWDDVDFERHTIRIQSRLWDGYKKGPTDTIPMRDGVREVLLREFEKVGKVTRNRTRLPERANHVFGKPKNSDSISDRFARVAIKSGLRAPAIPGVKSEATDEDLTFHDLRHEGISRLFADKEKDYSIPEVAVISGHIKWDTLSIYTQLNPEDF
jgi:integrase